MWGVPVEETDLKHLAEYAREFLPKGSETGDNDEEVIEAAKEPNDGSVGAVDVNAVAK
jgi:hypothetical protein